MSFHTLAELTLVTDTCCRCGVLFAMPEHFVTKRRESGESFYCPNGHSLVYKASEVTRLKRQLERVEATATHLRDQRDAADRSNAALRGVITKQRKRAAAGVCQCCQRTFQNVAEHMQTEHPDFVAAVRE